MSENRTHGVVPPGKGSLFTDLALNVKLIMRLMADPRVNPLVKLLPVAAIVYLVSPLDLAIGPFDDAAVIGVASYLFMELCPPDVVQEHTQRLKSEGGLGGPTGGAPGAASGKEDVIDGEFWEKKP